MRSFKKAITLLLFILIGQACLAQQQLMDSVVKKFQRYRLQLPQEKIYLHVDRTTYLTGETSWFSIYCVNGSTHLPMDMSKVVYIELLDKNNNPSLQTKVELKNSRGNGSLFIPATLPTGNYTLRAYTNWMKNVSPDFFFHQSISIVNAFREAAPSNQKPAPYDIQFLPEGGHLVDGLESTIAYRVTDSSGKGLAFSGSVIGTANDTLVRFNATASGIGKFNITPSLTESYRIILKDNTGVTQTTAFPQIDPEGFALRLNDEGEKITLQVRGKFKNLVNPFVYLMVHCRNQIVSSTMQYLTNGTTALSLQKKSLPEGITHITLFNSELQPVCERLYFKRPENSLGIKIGSDQSMFGVRRKVKLTFTTSPQRATGSISVYRSDSLNSFHQKNIEAYFHLTSDLHGEVESPDQYFEPGSEAIADLLMLTHGWRRFSWKKILATNSRDSLHLPEFHGHVVTGRVTDEAGKPAASVRTFLSYPSKKVSLNSTVSDRQGNIRYILKHFHASKLILQTDLAIDSVHRIGINNPFSTKFSERSLPILKLNPIVEHDLSVRSVAMQVQDIFREESVADPAIDTTAFYGKANETYYLDAFTRFPVMEEVMREYVPGVFLRKGKQGFYFMALDARNNTVFKESPLVLLDGVPIFNINKLMAFDPVKVKKLEVMTTHYYLGNVAFQGIVSYSTYTGDLAGFQIHPKSVSVDYEGLQQQREFYSPRYETDQQRNSRLPDQRHLLYWNPNVEIKNGIAEIEFYTSDLEGEFCVQFQGSTFTGQMGSASHRIQVKRFDN
jgi:hypothetical protein